MAAEVLPLPPVKLPTGPGAITPDQKYWRSFSSQQLIPTPHSTAVTHISFPPTSSRLSTSSPETFAITSGSRVQIFSSRTCKLLKTITRFGIDDRARSGEIRRDGRVLVAGGDSGAIQVFDANSRAILKTWKEHKQPVWVTRWHPTTLTALMSASDDKTVRLWDLPSGESTTTLVGHQDYVRCGAWMPGQGAGLLVTGSYDQTVRLWDQRTAAGKAVMCFKHAAPVENVLPLLSGTTLVSASDNQISVLDLVAARPVQLLKNHQKTVTSLSLASKGTRVVSGALDGHVKVFETAGWNVVAGFKYSAPVLALSVITGGPSQEDRHLAVGLENGLLSVKTRLSGQQKVQARERQKEMKALVEGKIEEYDKQKAKKKRGRGWEKRLRGKDYTGEEADIVIEGNDRGRIKHRSKWEAALRKGQYEKALDLVLGTQPVSRQDALTLLTALIHRSALRTALSGRNEETLKPIIRFVIKNINDPRVAGIAGDTASLVLDMYAEHMGQSPEIDRLISELHESVRRNAEVAQMAWASRGMLDLLMAGS